MSVKKILLAMALFTLTLPSVVMAKKSGKGSPVRRSGKRNPSSLKKPANQKKKPASTEANSTK